MAEDVFGIVGTVQAGSFQVERVVAEGGFGVVYLAQHGAFRAPVALKCLKIPTTMSDEQREAFLEKFRSEAELLFRLSRSIAEVVRPLHHDVLQLPDGRYVPFLALEWLDGEALDAVVTRRRKQGQAPIGLHKLVKLLRPIAQALVRAHRFPGPNGPVAIVHRDLKPENIFLARINGAEEVKVLDFGIAKARSASAAMAGRQTGDDALNAFTPAYAAPEQWVPKRFGQSGPWTDVWGMAITMVEVLSGKPPIEGDISAMMGTAIDERRRPTPRAEGVVISDEADQVFERALAVDPRDRYKDVDTFWRELERAVGSGPSLRVHDARREDGPSADEPTGRLSSSRPPRGGKISPPPPPPDPGALESPLDSAAPPPIELMPISPRASSSRGEGARPASSREGPASPPRTPSPLPEPRPSPAPSFASDTHRADPSAPTMMASAVSTPLALRSAASTPLPPKSGAPTPLAPHLSPVHAARAALVEVGLLDRLRLPLWLIGAGLAMTAVDIILARLSIGPMALGPVTTYWIAAPLSVSGVGLACFRVFTARNDG